MPVGIRITQSSVGPCLGFLAAVLLTACNLGDDSEAGTVFTCDAKATVAEMCVEEPISTGTREASKRTCLEVKGAWSDASTCPSGYKKKCTDGDKTNYYYANSDGDKSCSDLVAVFGPARVASLEGKKR